MTRIQFLFFLVTTIGFAMALKYQSEIDSFKFDFTCPNNVNSINEEVEVFRFSHIPNSNSLNCLPNVVYDKLTGGKFDYSRPGNNEKKCRRCGASFYYEKVLAKGAWNSMGEKLRENLKYTHLAKGVLSPGDGLITEADRFSHFGFYENENDDDDYLKKKLEIIEPL